MNCKPKIIYCIPLIFIISFVSVLAIFNVSNADSFNGNEVIIADGYYKISSAKNSNYNIEVGGGSFNRGSNVSLWEENGTDSQIWKLENLDNGNVSVSNFNSGLMLDITDAVVADCSNIQSQLWNKWYAQQWKLVKVGDSYKICSALNNNYVINLYGGLVSNGTNIQLYHYDNTLSCLWNISKVEPIRDIPSIDISLNGVTLDQINAGSKEVKYAGNSVSIDSLKEVKNYINVELKGRGNSTWTYPKKPYQIKFEDKENLFNLGASKKWVLLANYSDSSELRNDLAFNIAQQVGMQNTWGGQFVNLYVDKQYIGIYWLTHKVEIGNSTLPLDNDEATLTEMDWRTPDDIYFTSAIEHYQIVLNDTKWDNEQEALINFKKTYDSFEKSLWNGDWDEVKSKIDVNSFVYFCVMSDLTCNADTFALSTFLYKKDFNDILHCGPIWDFDLGFFNYPGNYLFNDPFRTNCYFDLRSKIYWKLMDIPEFRKLCEDTYINFVSPKRSQIRSALLDRVNYINVSANKDHKKWNLSSFQDATNRLISLLDKRFDYLDLLYVGDTKLIDGVYSITSLEPSLLREHMVINQTNDGFFTLSDYYTGQALTVSGGAKQIDTKVVYSDLVNSDSQKWLFCKHKDSFKIVSKITGLVLDDLYSLHITDWNDSKSQCFQVEKVGEPQPELINGNYLISSRINTKKEIEIGGGSSSENAFASIFDYNNTEAQKWNIATEQETGLAVITNIKSNKVLQLFNNSLSLGNKICQCTRDDSKLSQKWKIYNTGNGYMIVSALKSNYVFDLPGQSVANGTVLQVYTSNGTVAQRFDLFEINPIVDPEIIEFSDGDYFLCSALNKNLCIDLASETKNLEGGKLQLWTKVNNNNNSLQVFHIAKEQDGYYRITSTYSQKSFDVDCGCPIPGTKVHQWSSADSKNQKWVISIDADGLYYFRNVANGLMLNVSSGSAINGQNINTNVLNNSLSEKWYLKRIEPLVGDDIEGHFFISSQINVNKVIEISGGSITEHSTSGIFDYNNTEAQKWDITTDDITHKSVIRNTKSRKVLEVASGKASSNSAIWQSEFLGKDAQYWKFINDGDSYRIVSALCDNIVIDLPGASVANGTRLQTYSDNGTKAQKFLLFEADPIVEPTVCDLQDGDYFFEFGNNTKYVIDLATESQYLDGGKLQTWLKDPSNSPNQIFHVTKCPDGFYQITCTRSKKALDVDRGCVISGTLVHQWPLCDSKIQKWAVQKDSNTGNYIFRNAASGLYLSVSGGSAANGRSICVINKNGALNYEWRLVPLNNVTIHKSSQLDY